MFEDSLLNEWYVTFSYCHRVCHLAACGRFASSSDAFSATLATFATAPCRAGLFLESLMTEQIGSGQCKINPFCGTNFADPVLLT